MAWRKLTDAQCREVQAYLPAKPQKRGRGKPPVQDRKCLEGILWILWTGCPWSELPRRYGAYVTCWRRLKRWEDDGTWERIWHGTLTKLAAKKRLKLDEAMIDGSFAAAKKGGPAVGLTRKGKGTKWMLTTDKDGTPLGAYLDAATPGETTLVQATLEHTPQANDIERLVADKGYDSNPLRAELERRGIEPIIPAKATHTNATHQDGRKLRRYAHRFVIERTFAWLGWFRRLIVRHERLLTTYQGFFHFACALLALRALLK